MSSRKHTGWRLLVLPVGTAVLAGSTLSVVAMIAVRQDQHTVRRDAAGRVESNADAAGRAVARQSQDYIRAAQAAAASSAIVAALVTPGPGTRAASLEPLTTAATAKRAPAVFLTDLDGRYVVGYPTRSALRGDDLTSSDWFRGAASSGRAYVSRGFRSPTSGHPLVVAVATPVWDTGRRVGYLAMLWQLASIRALAEGSRRDDGVAVSVTDQGGRSLATALRATDGARLEDAGRLHPPADAVASATRQALAGHAVNTVREGSFVAAGPVPALGWTVSATLPAVTAMAPAGVFRRNLLATLALALLVLLGALAFAVRVALRSSRDRSALLISEESFRQVFDEGLTGKALTDTGGVILHTNRALTTLLGTGPGDLAGRSLDSLFESPVDQDDVRDLVRAGEGDLRTEAALHGSTEEERWGRVALHWLRQPGGRRVLLAQIEDVTARRLAEQRLIALALHDDLTGLPNRRLLMERCEQVFAVARTGRSGSGVVALFIDLDGFKEVNDRAGHHAGDQLLSDIAADLTGTLRPADTVARVGGDEFVALLGSDEGLDQARVVAHRLAERVTRQIPIRGASLAVTASIGIARIDLAVEPHAVPELLLGRADAAMYRAKERGRGRQDVFDDDLRASTEARYALEQAVRDGLAHDRIRLVYQPVVDLDSGTVLGAEALMRLHDQDGNLLPTLPAIIAAEHAGLAQEVGDRVLQLALETLGTWPSWMSVAVNVSARELTGDDFRRRVENALRRNGADPDRLVLEITESSMLHADRSALGALEALRSAGVRVAIDDFGTAYATLQNLTVLPVDLLKVDASFTAGLSRDRAATAVIQGVITMAKAMDVPCIIEGIETQAQLDALFGQGVLGQGWLWGKPEGKDVTPSIPRQGRGVAGLRPAPFGPTRVE